MYLYLYFETNTHVLHNIFNNNIETQDRYKV